MQLKAKVDEANEKEEDESREEDRGGGNESWEPRALGGLVV